MLTNGRTKEHLYQTCRDEFCQRYACRVYREGYFNGKLAGVAQGRAEGEAIGYDRGYTAGAASCGDG